MQEICRLWCPLLRRLVLYSSLILRSAFPLHYPAQCLCGYQMPSKFRQIVCRSSIGLKLPFLLIDSKGLEVFQFRSPYLHSILSVFKPFYFSKNPALTNKLTRFIDNQIIIITFLTINNFLSFFI